MTFSPDGCSGGFRRAEFLLVMSSIGRLK